MENRPIKFIDSRLIALLIFVLNLIFFLVYYFAHPDATFLANLWEYLSSAIFTLVTGSLIIPLLFSMLEKRYKFLENIQKEREDKRKELEDQRKLNRRETINSTIAMWQELYDLVTQLIYYEPNKKNKIDINDIIIEMIKFPTSAEVTVNKWAHQFPNLKHEDNDTLLHFVNIVYQSALSIALYIQRGIIDEKQCKELQDTLFLIQDQVKSIVHHRMIDVFKYSATLLELEESKADETLIKEKREDIRSFLDNLHDWVVGLTEQDNVHDNFLAPNEGAKIDEIRNTARDIEKWLKEDKERQVFQSQQFTSLRDQFFKISLEDRVGAAAIPYSIDYIRATADWLSFESACMYIYNRTHKVW